MNRRLAPVLLLVPVALLAAGCASEPMGHGEPMRDRGSDIGRDVKRAIGFRDAPDLLDELRSGSAAGFAFDFSATVETVASAARQTLRDYGLGVTIDTSEGATTYIVAETGVNSRGLGELVGLSVSPVDAELSHVLIVSRKRLEFAPFEKDWTSDILAGLKARLEAPALAASAPTPAEPVKPSEAWLAEVQTMVTQAFANVDSPALIVVCEGKSGGYLADRIISALGTIRKSIRIVANGKDLDMALKEQEKSVSGVYDQATAVKVGRLRGARYAFYGTPYVKRSAGVVELSCKILDIESGDYLNAGRIVTLPLSELLEE